jgi:hypothetical protein
MNINIEGNKNIKFEARPDNLNRYLTIILWILLFSFYIFLYLNGIFTKSIYLSLILVILFLMHLAVFLLAPRSYELTQEAIIIHRWAGRLKIDRSIILSAEICLPDDLVGAMRLFGSYGFHGYMGWFRSSSLGNFLFYASNGHDCVKLIRSQKKPLIISPHTAESFLTSFKAQG